MAITFDDLSADHGARCHLVACVGLLDGGAWRMWRLGWLASDAFRWCTDGGLTFDVRDTAPSATLRLVRDAISRMLWREWAVAPVKDQTHAGRKGWGRGFWEDTRE